MAKIAKLVAKPIRRGVAFRVAVLLLVDACKMLLLQHLNRRDARGLFYPACSSPKSEGRCIVRAPVLQLTAAC